jgi:hypothetical protein
LIFGRKRQAPPPSQPREPRPEALAVCTVANGRLEPPRASCRRLLDPIFDTIYVPSLLLDHTYLQLRQAGVHGDECFVVWAGTVLDCAAVVSSIVRPATFGRDLHGEVPAHVVGRVLEALDTRDLVPIAQIHTHPRAARISHIDEERPFVSVRGFLSIIIPDFGFTPSTSVERWGVYEFESKRNWREWNDAAKLARLLIDDSLIGID